MLIRVPLKECSYFCRNFLENNNGIDFIFSEKKIRWDEIEISMDSNDVSLELTSEDIICKEVYKKEILENRYRLFTAKNTTEIVGHLKD